MMYVLLLSVDVYCCHNIMWFHPEGLVYIDRYRYRYVPNGWLFVLLSLTHTHTHSHIHIHTHLSLFSILLSCCPVVFLLFFYSWTRTNTRSWVFGSTTMRKELPSRGQWRGESRPVDMVMVSCVTWSSVRSELPTCLYGDAECRVGFVIDLFWRKRILLGVLLSVCLSAAS